MSSVNHELPMLLLSTCGASVLLNDAPELGGWLRSIANTPRLDAADANRLESYARARRQVLLAANTSERRRLSAELNGIHAVMDRWSSRQTQHLLVHTDTAIGKASAYIVHECLVAQGRQAQLLTSGGLRTDDSEEFRQAVAALTYELESWVRPNGQRRSGSIIFNLTAGFKSLNAYLQALGMVYADRCVFLFESSKALMEIPRLPVQLAEADELRKHLELFRRLAVGYRLTARDSVGVPEALLINIDDQVSTSVWGDVVWRRTKDALLSERLLDPLSPRIVISDRARGDFEDLSSRRHREDVNDALDALSAHLDHGRRMPVSREFKELKGNPKPPCTHELRLWNDGSAGRLYGYYEGSQFVVHTIDKHL